MFSFLRADANGASSFLHNGLNCFASFVSAVSIKISEYFWFVLLMTSSNGLILLPANSGPMRSEAAIIWRLKTNEENGRDWRQVIADDALENRNIT